MQLSRDSQRAMARIQRAVDKFNAIRNEILSRGGSEDDVYYDNSSTYDSGTTYASEMKFLGLVDNYHESGPAVVVEFQMKLNSYEKELSEENIVGWVEEYEGEFTFDYERMLDDIRYYTNCVRRALRLWKEYNPSDEDEEGMNRKWERSEAARDVEERFIMKKNNRHIVDEEFDGEFNGPRIDLVKEMKRTVLAKAIQYSGRVSRRDLEYSLRKYYPEATDEEIEMAINGDVDIYGESVDAGKAFNASTFSRMKWLGESSETLEYSTPYVDGETAPENTVDDEDAIRSLMSAWNRIADRFAERMRQHGYSPQLADAIVTAAAGRFCKSIESGI